MQESRIPQAALYILVICIVCLGEFLINYLERKFNMFYWITLIILLVLLLAIILYIWRKKIVKKEMENDIFGSLIVVGCMLSLAALLLSIDIPSALKGGQEVYVNELPTYHYAGHLYSHIETDNEELKNLKFGNWNKYEKYGHYRIRYTKFIKFVLDIEKLD